MPPTEPEGRRLRRVSYQRTQEIVNTRYPLTKVLDVFLAIKLAQSPATKGIRVATVDPGLCYSELRRDTPLLVIPIVR